SIPVLDNILANTISNERDKGNLRYDLFFKFLDISTDVPAQLIGLRISRNIKVHEKPMLEELITVTEPQGDAGEAPKSKAHLEGTNNVAGSNTLDQSIDLTENIVADDSYSTNICLKIECTICGGDGSMKCDKCDGTGKSVCSLCGGSGTYRFKTAMGMSSTPCTMCEATGRQRCPQCIGRGKVKGHYYNENGTSRELHCKSCNGSGYIESLVRTNICVKAAHNENSGKPNVTTGNAAEQAENQSVDKTDRQKVQQSQNLNEQATSQTGELPSLAKAVKDLKTIAAQAATANDQTVSEKPTSHESSSQEVSASKENKEPAAPKEEIALLDRQDISSLVKSVSTIATAELAKVEIAKMEVPQQKSAQSPAASPTTQQSQTTPATTSSALNSIADKSGLTMIRIPNGTFLMGSSDAPNETPAHRVTIASFYMDESEVSQDAYQRVMGSPPRSFFKGPKLPVDSLKWPDAVAFCNAAVS
ncbi:MAG: SUMF1/EgtB/PvdO family nonheme iron enzyme, partial [bacterium]|nr:SUMF1/EgtB/PvdO family nonheme iron enzyme [bacterium]